MPPPGDGMPPPGGGGAPPEEPPLLGGAPLGPCTADSLQPAVINAAIAMSIRGLNQIDFLLADPLIFMISRLLIMRPGDDHIHFRSDLKGPTSLALSIKTGPEFRLIP